MAPRGLLTLDALHVINLDRRPERLKRFVNRIRNELDWAVPIIRHAAVDTAAWSTTAQKPGLTPSLATYVDQAQLAVIARGYRTSEHELSRGAVGCALSHMALWAFLQAQRDVEYLAIFEDDAVWIRETHPPVLEFVETLRGIPNDWDILSLGCEALEVAANDGDFNVLTRFWQLHAYIVHRSAVPKLLQRMLPMQVQADAALSEKTTTDGLKIVAPVRAFFWQQAPETDVQVPLHMDDGTIRYTNNTYRDAAGILRYGDGTAVEPS